MESKETKNKMNDELFDVLLKHAAVEYMRQEAEKLEKETASPCWEIMKLHWRTER